MMIAKVPGDLTCAAHAVTLAVLAEASKNIGWFGKIKDNFDKIVRKIYDVEGKFLAYEVKPHILRDDIPDLINEKGQELFAQLFGTDWYWDDLVDGTIRGINQLTSDKPNERNFMEHANPFFMVCSYLFKCKILIATRTGFETEFIGERDGPIIRIYSDMNSGAGTHFDAYLPNDMDKSWFPNIDNFGENGPSYKVDDREYRDIIPRIDLWHSFLGNKYKEVLDRYQQFISDNEFAERLQEQADAELAAKLSADWNE